MFYIGIVMPRQKHGGQVGVIAFRNLAVDFFPSVHIPNDHDAALEELLKIDDI